MIKEPICRNEECKCPECLDTQEQLRSGCRFGTPDVCTKLSHPDCWVEIDGCGPACICISKGASN